MAINFGDVLGGLGAAYGGRAQEYAEGIRQREQGLTEQKRAELEARQRAMYQDGYQAFQMLAEGDLDGIINLANDRLEVLSTFDNVDASDTLGVIRDAEAAKAGDPTAIRNLSMTLSSAAQTAERMGLVPNQAEYTLSPGERRMRGTKVIAEVPEAPVAEEQSTREFVQSVKPDGTMQSLMADRYGNFFDLQGRPVQVSPSDRIIEGTSLTGSQADVGLTNAEAEKMRDAEVGTKTFIATTGDAIRMLNEQPDINTFVAGAASLVNTVQQEGKAIARAIGANFDDSVLDPASYSSEFDSLGIQNERMRGLITSLAFQAAAASGQSGRDISNADVLRFVKEVGANSSDPRAFAATLRDVAQRTDRGFRINYETRLGSQYEGDTGLSSIPGFSDNQQPTPTSSVGRFQIEVLPNG